MARRRADRSDSDGVEAVPGVQRRAHGHVVVHQLARLYSVRSAAGDENVLVRVFPERLYEYLSHVCDAAAYGEIYAAEYNVALETECLYGNDGLQWIKAAIEAAGTDDPAALRDQLEATESFDGLLGHMSIDPENHNPSRDAAIFRVDSDQVTYVGIYEP